MTLIFNRDRGYYEDNLNDLLVEDGGHDEEKYRAKELRRGSHSIIDDSKDVQVFFRDIKSHLLNEIDKATGILGCVAWLTDGDVLDALANKAAAIVVQKEDFLRPDIDFKNDSSWHRWLWDKYSKVEGYISKLSLAGCVASEFDWKMFEERISGIRCVGNHNSDKVPASPRMHNKFMIFGMWELTYPDTSNPNYEQIIFKPYAVWTGSFNFTKNAGYSLENAVLIKIPEVVDAYYQEFGHILGLSEPLNWEDEWVAPTYRIGS